MKQFFGKKKLAKLVTLSVMAGAMLGVAGSAWAEDKTIAQGETLELKAETEYGKLTNNGTLLATKIVTTNGWTLAEGSVTVVDTLVNEHNVGEMPATGTVNGTVYAPSGTLDMRGVDLRLKGEPNVYGGTPENPTILDTLKVTRVLFGDIYDGSNYLTIKNIVLENCTTEYRAALGVYYDSLTVDNISVNASENWYWDQQYQDYNYQMYTGFGGTLTVNESLTTGEFMNASSSLGYTGILNLSDGAVLNCLDFQNTGNVTEETLAAGTVHVNGAGATLNAAALNNHAITNLGTVNLTGHPVMYASVPNANYGPGAVLTIGALNFKQVETGAVKNYFRIGDNAVTTIGALTSSAIGADFYVTGTSDSTVNEDGGQAVQYIGDIVFAKYSDSDSVGTKFSLNLDSSDDYFTGSVKGTTSEKARWGKWGWPINDDAVASTDNIKGMTLNLSNGATWTMTGDSFINNLMMSGATIAKDTSVHTLTLQGGNSSITDSILNANVVVGADAKLATANTTVNGDVTLNGKLDLKDGAVRDGSELNCSSLNVNGIFTAVSGSSIDFDADISGDNKLVDKVVATTVTGAIALGNININANNTTWNETTDRLELFTGDVSGLTITDGSTIASNKKKYTFTQDTTDNTTKGKLKVTAEDFNVTLENIVQSTTLEAGQVSTYSLLSDYKITDANGLGKLKCANGSDTSASNTRELTIYGNGYTLDGDSKRGFEVGDGGTLNLVGFGKIVNFDNFVTSDKKHFGAIDNVKGVVNITNGMLFVNNAGHGGGAIRNADGTVTVEGGVTFERNFVISDGEPFGGAIYNEVNYANSSTFVIDAKGEDVKFIGNGNYVENTSDGQYKTKTNRGGAIFNRDGAHLAITNAKNVVFDGNTASQIGGAIENKSDKTDGNSSELNIGAETIKFINNATNGATEASAGGAVYVNQANMTLVADTILFMDNGDKLVSDRTEDKNGGGALYVRGAGTRDTYVAIGKEDGSVTFEGNKTTAAGGAIGINSGEKKLELIFDGTVTFDGNIAERGGGAIWHKDDNISTESIVVFNGETVFKNNKAGSDINGNSTFDIAAGGGAIWNKGMIEFKQGATFTNNSAAGKGGAIYNDVGGVITFNGAEFSGNKASGTDNDIYNAGIINLNAVVFANITKNTVENASGGNINIGEGTRVTANTIYGDGTNVIVGGTLVTTQANWTTDDDKFTMTNGIVEMPDDYTLEQAKTWGGQVKTEYNGAFALKLTGDIIEVSGQTIDLQTVQENNLVIPKADVVATPTTDQTTSEKVVEISKDLEVGSLNVRDADKVVIKPEVANGSQTVEVILNNGIIKENQETKKLDMDLMEGADVKIISKDKLELDTLKALNNKSLTVTMEGDFVAEKFEVEDNLESGQVITFVVGGADSEKPSSLVLKDASNTGKLQVFVDPFIAKDIGEASSYSQAGTDVKAEIIGGRNSLIVLGETDRTKAEQVFNAMENDLTFGNAGDVNAVLYVAQTQTMKENGGVYLDGTLTAPITVTAKSFTAKAKSLTMVEAVAAGTSGAINGLTSANVDATAKLFIANAEPEKVYTILAGEGITSGWVENNVVVNGLIDGLTVELDATDKAYFKVTTGSIGFDVDDTVVPKVAQKITENTDSKAYEALYKMVDVPSADQQTANVNAYANLGENLGVSRGAYDVANMVGNAVTEHWDNNAKGENIWAVYTRNKTEVDGMKLGGMDAQYDAHYNGVVVGADLGKGFGIAVNYADGNISNRLGGHNDSEYYGASLYGRKVWGNFSLNMDAGYTYGKNELAQNGIEADAKTDTISAGLTAKYLAKAGKYDKIGLFAGVRYMHIDGKDYTDSLGVNREADKINSVIVPVGLEYTGEFKMAKSGWNWKPRLAVGYLFNLGDRENDMTMRYGGAEDIFGYDFVDKGAFFTHAGMEFEKKNFTLGISYDFMKSKNSKNNRWNINANVAF